ncbi:MAG: ATP-dependent helicase [Candidatus Obscuribacterales bacterium]|nr:ATP-dependent helicase [Candidatus Obscuribacterales bacterium]
MNTNTINLQAGPMEDTLTKGLNQHQLEAVSLNWGSSLVLAGAGSGKTTVLTKRAVYLLSTLKQAPESILAVTFTNKAAGEMRERVESLVGPQIARRLMIGTFHSICARLLRQEIHRYKSKEGLTWKTNFVIYDETDSMSLVKNTVQKLNLDEKVFAPREMRYAISALKNDGLTAAQFTSEARTYRDGKLSEIFNHYQAGLARNNALDFDDLILIFNDLLDQDPDLRSELQERFRHVLVDEFQDTNQSQYKLIRSLCREEPKDITDEELTKLWHERSLMVVGDVDQSIYSWRKADFRIILGFQKDYRQTRLIKLEDNYRSTASILEVANSIIQNNTERIEKTLRCNRGQGAKIKVYAGMDEIDEAYFVVEELKRLQARGINLSDTAILYRTNAQSRSMEEVLVRNHTPYLMIGGTRFYDRAEIKDVIAYLKLIYNGSDGQSFLRTINTPKRGLGKSSLDHLVEYAEKNNISLLHAAVLANKIPALSARAAKSFADFALLIERLQDLATHKSVSELLELLLSQSGYTRKLEEEASAAKDETAYGRLENLRELITVAQEFESLADEPNLESFLTRISLVSDLDAVKHGEDAVRLMTLHSSKGLEFKNVFLVGLEEGLFPHVRSINSHSPAALEEERRLMYVGVTRAEERLYITYSRKRASFMTGNFGSTNYTIPSRFLSEIKPDLLTGLESQPATPSFEPQTQNRYSSQPQQSRFGQTQPSTPAQAKPRVLGRYTPPPESPNHSTQSEPSFERFKLGDQVMHTKFGMGKVTQVIGEGEKELYNIEFQSSGKRLMDPKFAKLIKVN